MLECQSCLLRCLRAIAGEALPRTTPALRVGLKKQQQASIQSRRYTTTTATTSTTTTDKPVKFRERYDFQSDTRSFGPSKPSREERAASSNKRRKVEPITTSNTPAKVDESTSEYTSSISPQLERAVKKELVYLKDPLKHANHVRQTLRANELEKALALCRIASKEMQVIVSWNHTIDYLLARKEIKLALKTYNEMKKRAQFPDSHTYVILLRGLAIPPVHPDTVAKAVTIYHSLAAPNSRVVQSIIHTNAALKVCARGNNMDSLWGIASRIPDKGPAAADNFTFTTILNAIRQNALLSAGPRYDNDIAAHARQTAILEGRRIWQDIIGKWRKGDIVVDEELVCAMGRILLLGLRPRDWDDVLSLVEQTMNIPRLAAKLGTPARKADHLTIPRVLATDIEPDADEDPDNIMGEFDKELVTVSGRANNRTSVAYIRPSNNTLSLIIEACLKMASPGIANQYWDLLSAKDTYAIVPDVDNLNMYLRVLRQSRSSTRVVEVLKNDIIAKGIHPLRKTYRIAMSACNRDKENPHVIKNAGAILDMMENNQSEMDVKAAQIYLDLCLRTSDGKQIAHAINRLGPVITNLRSQLSLGSDRGTEANQQTRDEAMLLFRTVVGAIDVLTKKELIPTTEKAVWIQRRGRLSDYINRATLRMSQKTDSSDHPKVQEWKVKVRREKRQLRNFRRNEIRTKKRADGTWAARKSGSDLSDTPGDILKT